MGANYFLQGLTTNEIGGKNKNDRVASPESVPFTLKNYGRLLVAFGEWSMTAWMLFVVIKDSLAMPLKAANSYYRKYSTDKY